MFLILIDSFNDHALKFQVDFCSEGIIKIFLGY